MVSITKSRLLGRFHGFHYKKQATFALIVLALIVMSHNIFSYFISGGI